MSEPLSEQEKVMPTKKQLIERWENCLRVLKALTPHERRKHWDMSWWGEKTDCGTVACAAGHCGLDPWFRRRGFQLNFKKGYGGLVIDMPINPDDFFGLKYAYRVFYGSGSVSQVIRKVERVLKELRK